jgi:AraC-like DNA-binding protein
MPKNDPRLPKVLQRLGVAAWELPRATIRQMPTHSHPEAQLCGLDGGLAILETDAGAWTCPPGRCVWIPPGMVHSLRSCGKISGWMVRVNARENPGLPAEPRILALSPLLKQIVVRMMTWVENPKASPARQRLVDVLRDEISAASQIQLHLTAPRDPALKRLAVRLAENRETTKDLAALAREVGVSERSLFRNFHKETGLSPGQWRRQMQVLRSLELLAEGRSVTETSLEVGYESTGAFIWAFRRTVGVTPSSYAFEHRPQIP